MTGLDPLALWRSDETPDPSYMDGANDRLDALRPLIAAANELAAAALTYTTIRYVTDLAQIVRDLTTPKGETP